MKEVFIYKLTLFTVLFFLVQTSSAQVTIGSGNRPEKAALLDIASEKNSNPTGITDNSNITSSKGGVLIPRVKLVSETTLEPFLPTVGLSDDDKIKNAGLIVYNLNETSPFLAGFYTWTGAKWITYTYGFKANNAIEISDGEYVMLGGDMSHDTEIDQNDFPLIFDTNGASFSITPTGAGKVAVNTDVLVVNQNNVGIGKASPTVKLDVSTGGTSANAIEGFRLVDGSESKGSVLKSNSDGTAMWTAPGFGAFREIPYIKTTFSHIPNTPFYLLRDPNTGDPWYIDVEEYGTYNISMRINLSIKGIPVVYPPGFWIVANAVRFVPRPEANLYVSTVVGDSFAGAYESQGRLIKEDLIGVNYTGEEYVELDQNINVSSLTGTRLYMVLWIGMYGAPAGITATVEMGQTFPDSNRSTAGTYVKID